MSKKLRKNEAGEYVWVDQRESTKPRLAHDAVVVSDSLGVSSNDVEKFSREARGFDVEFKEDPDCRGFYQAHCASRSEWERYANYRGYSDGNSSAGGSPLGAEHIDKMAAKIREKYGPPKKV